NNREHGRGDEQKSSESVTRKKFSGGLFQTAAVLPSPRNLRKTYGGDTTVFELVVCPLFTVLLLVTLPLLVPYWSLVPPLSQPARINAAAAPAIKNIFFISVS